MQIVISPPLISSSVELWKEETCNYDRSESTESQVKKADQLLKRCPSFYKDSR